MLHLYYDMKFISFGIDNTSDLIMQFQVFVQSYSQSPLMQYQTEIVSVPLRDQNIYANSYLEVHIFKPYIAHNDEIYIPLRHQELQSCKHIGYDFYCEDLFVVKHESKYCCETVIIFIFPKKLSEIIVILTIIITLSLISLQI